MKIDVTDISKKYRSKTVLKNVSFSAVSGEMIGIIGVNGSGKSTLLSILANVRKGSGDFKINGKSVFSDKKLHALTVGYVPQTTPLINELTAKDNLLFWYKKQQLKEEYENGIIKILGVDKFIDLPVRKMSGGMKKRLAICCAMANKPSVLLLDEPTSALDIICQKTIMNYLEKYRAEGGIVITATHSIDEIEYCSRLFILKNGVLIPYVFNSDTSNLIEELSNE